MWRKRFHEENKNFKSSRKDSFFLNNVSDYMIFVPKEKSQATIKRMLAEISEREKKKSAEWRKNFYERC